MDGESQLSRRLLLGSLWGFVALAFVVGALIGASLPLWQKAAMEADMRVLQKRLSAAQGASSTVTPTTGDTEKLEQRLASAESSIALLTVENDQLRADLAEAKETPPPTTPTKPSTTQTTTPAPKPETGVFLDRSVAPATIAPNGSFTFTAKTKGSVSKVSMRIASSTSGVTYDYTYSLTKGATAAGVTTWTRTIKGPPKAGGYRLIGIAYASSGRANASAITLTVK